MTTGPGNEGAISKVIFSLNEPRSMRTCNPDPTIAAIDVEAVIPEVEGTMILRYRDGLRGTLDTVENFVLAGGQRISPSLGAIAVRLVPDRARFVMTFDGPSLLTGAPGNTVRTRYYCKLDGVNLGGPVEADGWSIALTAAGARIKRITVYGTAAEKAIANGFVRDELTSGPRNEGAVSTVIYSLFPPESLSLPAYIAALDVETVIPAGRGSAALRYRDGLRGTAGPVENLVSDRGESRVPLLNDLAIDLSDVEICGSVLFGFSAEDVDSPTPFEGIAGWMRASGEIAVPVREGDTGRAHVFADVISLGVSTECAGVDAWSLSVILTGDAEPDSASFFRTAGATRFQGGYEKTEVVDPSLNEGRRGFVSAVLLSFQCFGALPPVSTVSVLDMEVKASRDQGSEDILAELRFADGLRGSGQATGNTYYNGNVLLPPCNRDTASVTLRFRKGSLFVRGNANRDSEVDLADALLILRSLFNGGPGAACLDAVDSNDDGVVDVSDAVYLLGFLFLGGPTPPAPFPACGLDAEGDHDGLTCADTQATCL